MKRKLFAGLVTSLSVAGLCVASGASVLAAEVDRANTDVGIGFTEHGPGQEDGPLEITWAPLSLDFYNGNEVNTAVKAFPEISGNKKYTVVKDERAGATDEWKLTASLSELTSPRASGTGVDKLTGAELQFTTAVKGYEGVNPPESAGSVTTDARTAVAATSGNISAGAAATKVLEDGTAGSGTFQGQSALEMDNINLEVPANVAKAGAQYTGTLTWSLDDVI
ncbi:MULTISPECIES: WxL domain-containing protein [Enterococcus]|uniref:WxL domain-containing protein n=1 Tax=Candidatus Enterococcus murrayae TaxID=2815321 RepID=A0ABS3HED6_9ENTE|nr:WxL domain-containing protein [Enterococcus sp. MJM16]MBO0451820.1 WxL domain-containing protein [Enterococcus sp. MJM16]